MLKFSSSRGIRIDVPVLSVSWSFMDGSLLDNTSSKKTTYRARGQWHWRSPSLEVLLSRSSGRGYRLCYCVRGAHTRNFRSSPTFHKYALSSIALGCYLCTSKFVQKSSTRRTDHDLLNDLDPHLPLRGCAASAYSYGDI